MTTPAVLARFAPLGTALFLCACSAAKTAPAPADSGTTGGGLMVTTSQGIVLGKTEGTTRAFLGIPYAAPPLGDLRWKSPQPAASWTAPLDATTYGSICSQLEAIGSTYDAMSNEDCLTLNVFAPPSPAKPLPVMVWLHGGGFVNGAGADPAYDGQALSSSGDVIVVTINYRLGPLGFLAHPALTAENPSHPGSGDWGFEDQRAALTWVKTNIQAFGGDPGNVTLFGESAGAISTVLHSVSRSSQGLFARMIMESTPLEPLPTLADGEAQGGQLAAAVGCSGAGVLACLRGKTAQELTAALPAKQGFLFGSGFSWGPDIDGVNLTMQPAALVKAGSFAKVPTLLGSNANEGTLFVALAGLEGLRVASDADYQSAVASIFGMTSASEIVAQYPTASFMSGSAALAAAVGDGLIVCPTRNLARAYSAAGQPTFLYSFRHAIDFTLLGSLGAFHSSELSFVFGTSGLWFVPLTAAEMPLSSSIMGYWTRMAASGDPNGGNALRWPPYEAASDQNIVLDLTLSAGANLNKADCDFWATL